MDEFQIYYAISNIQSSTLEMKGRVYAICVRSSMIYYGNETRLLLADVGLMFERADMQMIKWMCGVSMKDRKPSEKNYEHRVYRKCPTLSGYGP